MGLTLNFSELFDSYSRQARLFPALLTVFAPLIALLAWFPSLLLANVGGALVSIAMSCGLLYLGASLARTAGKRTEKRLLKKWGAWPTTYLLRYSSSIDQHTLNRYRKFFVRELSQLHFPSEGEEKNDPRGADAVYASAIKWLKERVRGKDFPLVEKENAQYGFRRNMRGMKLIGASLCVATLAFSIIAIYAGHADIAAKFQRNMGEAVTHLLSDVSPAIWAAIGLNVVALLCWLFVVTDEWVKSGGEQYAEALLACCDRIEVISSG